MKKNIFFLIAQFVLFGLVSCENQSKTEPSTNTGDFSKADFSPSGKMDGYDYVDLGLSVKWATCNLGASSMEGLGDYYAWQEITPVNSLTYINYQLAFNSCNPETNILSSKFDAARMNMSKNWKMPTYDEQKELCENCYWTFVHDFKGTGVNGCIVMSKKSNKAIFLPVTGYMAKGQNLSGADQGYYWSSWAGPGDLWTQHPIAMALHFYEGLNFRYGGTWKSNNRYDGHQIRAVVGQAEEYYPEESEPLNNSETTKQGVSVNGKVDGYTYVDLGLPSRTLWATCNVGASTPKEYGDYFAWGETTPKDYYWDTTYKFYDGTNGDWNRYSKYTWFKEHHGTVDGKLILDPEDDAATQNMSPKWCMPTKAQWEELARYVKWTEHGTYWEGKSINNGYTIRLSIAGYEYGTEPNTHMHIRYWSSELPEPSFDNTDYRAYMVASHNGALEVIQSMRIQGVPVRAVVKKQ
jgi:hypothetical protein